MDRGAWKAAVQRVTEWDILEQTHTKEILDTATEFSLKDVQTGLMFFQICLKSDPD